MKRLSNQTNPHFSFLEAIRAIGAIFGGRTIDPAEAFGTENVLLTNTARSALGIIADVVVPDRKKRIALPAFICAVVATPFLNRGYEIEWIDTDENGLIDPADFTEKAKNVSLVVVPHIFGQPAPLEAIYKIAKTHDIFVVEDGAHLLNNKFDHCDARIWSFGREKVVSCVAGGALLWPAGSTLGENLPTLHSTSWLWQFRHAIQPLLFSLGQPWWTKGGRFIPGLARKLNILPLAVTKSERNGREDIPVRSLGKIQQRILKCQWDLQDQKTSHAQVIAQKWERVLSNHLPREAQIIIPKSAFRVILRFTSSTQKNQFLKRLSEHCDCRDWDGVPISPKGVNLKNFGYRAGQCPKAEKQAKNQCTLPTNIRVTENDLKQLEKHLDKSRIRSN